MCILVEPLIVQQVDNIDSQHGSHTDSQQQSNREQNNAVFSFIINENILIML